MIKYVSKILVTVLQPSMQTRGAYIYVCFALQTRLSALFDQNETACPYIFQEFH